MTVSPDAAAPRTLVLKIGGATLTHPAQIAAIAADMVALRARGDRLVVVHGGGPQVTEVLERMGMPRPRRAGRRVTDAPMLEVVKILVPPGRQFIAAQIRKRNQVYFDPINVYG